MTLYQAFALVVTGETLFALILSLAVAMSSIHDRVHITESGGWLPLEWSLYAIIPQAFLVIILGVFG